MRTFEETIDSESQQRIERILFWIPLLPLAFLSIRFGRSSVAHVQIRLVFWRWALRWCAEVSGLLLWLAGHFSALVALAVDSWFGLGFGYVLMLIAYLLLAAASLPIRMKVVDGFVHVTGIHPSYLARLAEFPLQRPTD